MTTLKPIHQERSVNPIHSFIDELFVEQQRRHSDIIRAGEQIRRWREEDRALSNTVKDVKP